jgi:DNA modification methylase
MRRWANDGVKVQTCVTSPPYFGLRDYGHNGQIGLEQTPEEYIKVMVEVFRCVWDVLADDGTLWLNIGDSYAAAGGAQVQGTKQTRGSQAGAWNGEIRKPPPGIKSKDLIGIPWALAFALRADGYYLRQDIIWHKPNPMPESVRDRCTKAHEYIFLLSKSDRYYYDQTAVLEDAKWERWGDQTVIKEQQGTAKWIGNKSKAELQAIGKKNRRSVWSVATRAYKGAHFATFPPALIEPCILAGSRPGDIVLDPFMGSGTTAMVSLQHGRKYLGCELNREYEKLQIERINEARNLFTEVA